MSAAGAHSATGGAEIAAVLADHRVVAAFAAQGALHQPGLVFVAGGFENAHLASRVAGFVKHAEHGVAVDDQRGQVGDGGRPVLLTAGAGHEGHEVAQGFRIVDELAQLHADPGRVHDAHVEGQDARQAVQGARVVARQPHGVGAGDAVRQGDFLEAEDEVFAGGRVLDIHRPGQGAVGAGLGLLQAEHAVEHRGRQVAVEGIELLAAVAHHLGEGGDHSRHQLAFAAADAVSRRPGQSYNPLFIYGGVGLGKTHLLQAIGNATKNRFADKHVVYTTADKFLSDYVDSVKRRNTDNLRDRYAAIDVLIIDDIQFLARKTQTQEELYNIFNILYDAKKQIVLSGDRAPRELEELEPRLKSRFESGIIVDVAIPDYETKLAIIQGKISERGFRVEKEVLEYIAFHAGENIRELEGILNQIVAQYELTAVPPTLDNVAKLLNRHSVTQVRLGSTLVEPVSKVRSYEDLLDHVAKHF